MLHRHLSHFLGSLSLVCLLLSPRIASSEGAAAEMAEAAANLLFSLNPEQKSKASFDFSSDERLNWHFIPRARKGLPLKEMTAVQQRLAQVLLASGLSQRGYAKALTIMTLEQILRETEQGRTGMVRDEELYYVSIFGQPGDPKEWGWRVEGHHLALNFTIAKGDLVAASPSFFGTNPADVLEGPRKGLRVLGKEEDLGRALFKALSAEQQKVALLSATAPKDIFTEAQRRVKPLAEAGLAFGKMKKEQQAMLRELVLEYVNRYRSEIAGQDLAKIEKAGWSKLRFAWAGGTEKFQGHYFRVQGPTFLLEYDNVQNNNNHIHTVWRDFENDFGADVLQEHYQRSH
ncbi:MAG: DUF3500 domain-containing protein [Verrucomicrobiales bacterium]|nr:DUF3500 domain-containing protein [Verrucomicrobiales bacterium]